MQSMEYEISGCGRIAHQQTGFDKFLTPLRKQRDIGIPLLE
jgi:hypothetical protein